ncbi:hypothetical protein EJB05_35542, partial [Eragrostis curvula]
MAAHPHHGGSYTPVIVVLVFVAVLTAGSVAVGQLFVGSRGRRRTGYDLEAYVERKFAVCLGIEPVVAAVRPARRKKRMACLPQLADGAEEVEPSDAAPRDDDEESGSSQPPNPDP